MGSSEVHSRGPSEELFDAQPCGIEAGQEDVLSASKPGELAVEVCSDFGFVLWEEIAQVLFDVAVSELLGVELRSIGRQRLHDDPRMCGQELFDLFCPVDACVIPYEDKAFGQRSEQTPEYRDDVARAHAAFDMALVEFSPCGECRHGGDNPALRFPAFEHGSMAANSPGAGKALPEAEAELIKEEDWLSSAPRFFLYAASPFAAMRGSPPHRPLGPSAEAVVC